MIAVVAITAISAMIAIIPIIAIIATIPIIHSRIQDCTPPRKCYPRIKETAPLPIMPILQQEQKCRPGKHKNKQTKITREVSQKPPLKASVCTDLVAVSGRQVWSLFLPKGTRARAGSPKGHSLKAGTRPAYEVHVLVLESFAMPF